MTIKPGGPCVTVAEALTVLDAMDNPISDNLVLTVAGPGAWYDEFHHLQRIIRNRVEKLGLRLDADTPCFAPGPSTLAGYGVWPVRDYAEAVHELYPPQTCERPPRAVEPLQTGFDMDAYDAWRAENAVCQPSRPMYHEINIFRR